MTFPFIPKPCVPLLVTGDTVLPKASKIRLRHILAVYGENAWLRAAGFDRGVAVNLLKGVAVKEIQP